MSKFLKISLLIVLAVVVGFLSITGMGIVKEIRELPFLRIFIGNPFVALIKSTFIGVALTIFCGRFLHHKRLDLDIFGYIKNAADREVKNTAIKYLFAVGSIGAYTLVVLSVNLEKFFGLLILFILIVAYSLYRSVRQGVVIQNLLSKKEKFIITGYLLILVIFLV